MSVPVLRQNPPPATIAPTGASSVDGRTLACAWLAAEDDGDGRVNAFRAGEKVGFDVSIENGSVFRSPGTHGRAVLVHEAGDVGTVMEVQFGPRAGFAAIGGSIPPVLPPLFRDSMTHAFHFLWHLQFT